MPVGEFCTRSVVVTAASTDVQTAAKLMRKFHVGDLVVITEQDGFNVPIGIVTDRDLVVEVLAQDINPDSITVGDIMSQTIHVAQQSDDLFDVLNLMADKGIRRVPVVNSQGVLEGLLTLDDLLEVFAEQIHCLVRGVSKQQRIEKTQRN